MPVYLAAVEDVVDRVDLESVPVFEEETSFSSFESQPSVTIRKDFPETFIWNLLDFENGTSG